HWIGRGNTINATVLTLTKLAPVIVTLLPMAPFAGEKPLMTGVMVTVKIPALCATPLGVRTVILSVVAPAGTVAVSLVEELIVKLDAAAAPKLTLVAPARLAPEMVTTVPTLPPVGEKPVMAGAVVTVKFAVLLAEPVGVVTEIGPVSAPAGTVAT